MMISRAQAWRLRLALSALAVMVAGGLAGVAQNTADPIRNGFLNPPDSPKPRVWWQAMKKLVWAETRVEGGKPFTGKLVQPPSATGPFQNVGGSGNAQGAETPSRYGTWYADAAVVAFRVPGAARSMAELQPALSSSSGAFTLAALTDGDYATPTLLPAAAVHSASFAQAPARQPRAPEIDGAEVFKNDDVVFHQIDEHTWVGSGHMMASESLYLVEGSEKAVLIDAGTRIADLDKIVASLTKKPVMLVVTHAHPDHTGSAINYFPELYIGAGDAVSSFLSAYKGRIKDLKDGDVIELGGRTLDVAATPGHTPGSTTFIDKAAGYGFSGDSFGSGNLLLGETFSTLLATCQKTSALMAKYGIKHLYPGHFFGKNAETKQRLDDMATISRGVLSGKVKGEPNPRGMMGLNLIITAYGVRINYSEAGVK